MARLIAGAVFQRPIEKFFEEKGVFPPEKLAALTRKASETGQAFEVILAKESGLPEESLFRLIAEASNLSFNDGQKSLPFDHLPERIASICIRENLFAVSLEGRDLVLATSQPGKCKNLAPLFSTLGYETAFQVATPSAIASLMPTEPESSPQQDLYSGIHSLASTLKGSETRPTSENEKISDISVSLDTPSISELVNKTLLLAVNQGASDIHAESTQAGARIRFRIDGVLVDRLEIDTATAAGFFSRLMIMSHLDITEKVMPQDGSFKVNCEDREVEFRIACMPGIFGQNTVLRLLSGAENVKLSLETIGMLFDELELLGSVTRSPHGMILVAGPTGSGKSTTLYGVLESLADPRLKFITIEDPVERRIQGVQQTQVRVNRNEPERSLTFARGLRTILRLDPDIIMVGEIRDSETAQISMQASMTGHLVLSTVHANSSAETLSRLHNIGVDFHLLMSCLNLVFSQRLMRKLCPECRQPRPTRENEQALFGKMVVEKVYTAVGCPTCLKMGYSGRTGIFEFLPVDDEMRDLVAQNGLTESMKFIREKRLRTLFDSALIKVGRGVTDFTELERVCGPCL